MKTDGNNANQPAKKKTTEPQYRDTYEQRRCMAYIIKRIKNGHPTTRQLAKELGKDKRTIRRYKERIKTEQTLTAKFSREKGGFIFEEDVAISSIAVTERELMAMTVAQKDLEHRNAGMDKSITSALKKIVSTASSKLVKKLKNWERIISFRMSGETVSDPKVFDTLLRSADNQRKLKIAYKDPEGKETKRQIDPLHLCNINGDWYLFAMDYLRGEIRTFCPCRLKILEELNQRFEWPDKWTVNEHLKNSFGVFEGKEGEIYHTVIRFTNRVADFVREKKWKGQTAVVNLPCGGVELHQTLDSLFELQIWLMKWGRHAEVISPPELRESVVKEIKAMAAVYETKG